MKIKALLEYGRSNLIEKEEPIRVSKMVLKHLLKVEDSYLIIHEKEEVTKEIEQSFKKAIESLNQGKPLQYITHHQEFMKLNFYVDENVLIPQPDTEILVEEVIKSWKERKDTIEILDLCTGSGTIGIALAKYLDNAKISMSDISLEALAIAKRNADTNGVTEKSEFILSDLFENIDQKFDVIVSNPPYIPTEIIKTLDTEVQKEPILALNGGEDGLEFYRRIIKEAWKYLKKDGMLALEIGYDQREKVIHLLNQENQYTDIYFQKDLSNNDRIIISYKR